MEKKHELTPAKVAAIEAQPGRIVTVRDEHPKSAGLELRVFESGQRRWSLRYRNARGRQRRLTLGDAATIPLGGKGGARDLARQALLQIASGRDPMDEKQERREADTVEAFAQVYLDRYAKEKKRSWKNDQLMLNADIIPRWRHRAMKEITLVDVIELLDVIKDRGAKIQANRVRSLGSKMWKFAIQRAVVTHNPFRDAERPAQEKVRERALTPDEIRTFWQHTETLQPALRGLWRLRLYTAQRPQTEAARARWGEFDLDAGWWTIPKERTKNKREHRVPLSTPVVALLREIRPEKAKPEDFAFAPFTRDIAARSGKDFPLTDFEPRDLRRTAKTLMEIDGVPGRWTEEVLNHKVAGVEKHYNMHTYDSEKRQALDHLARRIDAILNQTEGAKVLPFAQRA